MSRIPIRTIAAMLVAGVVAAACQTAAVTSAPASKDPTSGGTPASAAAEQVVILKLKRFEFMPNVVHVKKGVPVVIEMTALDRTHGFLLKAFGIDEDVFKGKVTRVRFIPDKAGTFEFHCDNFCGDNHEDMTATLIVDA
jgi:cytochrome c oxidase subunit II